MIHEKKVFFSVYEQILQQKKFHDKGRKERRRKGGCVSCKANNQDRLAHCFYHLRRQQKERIEETTIAEVGEGRFNSFVR
jgi:hypothetical protein